MMDLDLRQLRSFMDVADLGSFSAAADKAGLTQPAISLHIRLLEKQLGVRLIERVGRRAQPTAAGRDFLIHARRIAEEVAHAIDTVAPHRSGVTGRLRIGTGATACIYRLPPILTALRAAHPGLEIIVVTGNTPDILDAVEAGTLDLALVTLPAVRAGLSIEPVCSEELVCVGPIGGDGKSATSEGIAPAALADGALILYERGGTMRAVIDGWFLAGGVQPRPAMELGNVEAIKNLVAAGLGRSILPSVTVQGPGDRDRFAVQPLSPPLVRTLGLVLRRDKVPDPGVRAMVRAIADMRYR